MPFNSRYRDVDRRDVAYWLAVQVIEGLNIPTPAAIRDRYGMSRSACYRWHQWAKTKRDQYNASRRTGRADAHH